MTPLERQEAFDKFRAHALAYLELCEQAWKRFEVRDPYHLINRHDGKGTLKYDALVEAREYIVSGMDFAFSPHCSTTELAAHLGLTNHSTVVLMRQRLRERKFSQPLVPPNNPPIV
jgi:hypothetical protein